MILPLQCLAAVIITSFPLLTFADYFMNPPNVINYVDGSQMKTKDLSTVFTSGQTVRIAWFVPSLPNISLSINRWNDTNDTAISWFLRNKQNIGYHMWTIGIDDGIDLILISSISNFGFRLQDPTGKLTSTGHPAGFIGSTLSSRGFIIQPNLTTSSKLSTFAPTLSTLSPSSEPTVHPPSKTSSSAGTTPSLHYDLSRSTRAGLISGLCLVSILALLAVLLLYFQRRIAKKVQAENADLIARMEGLTGLESMRSGLQASLNAGPPVELSTFPSFPPFDSELELGNSRLPRLELSAQGFPEQELEASTLSIH